MLMELLHSMEVESLTVQYVGVEQNQDTPVKVQVGLSGAPLHVQILGVDLAVEAGVLPT